jgi:hypothetical protein
MSGFQLTRIFLSLYVMKDEVAVHLSLRSLDLIHIREFRNIMKLLRMCHFHTKRILD